MPRIRVVVPLSGRAAFWPSTLKTLKNLWSAGRKDVTLHLLDTSQDSQFFQMLCMSAVDLKKYYTKVQVTPLRVGQPGLADMPRHNHLADVQSAMCEIYQWLLCPEIYTDYVFTLEDDIIPPIIPEGIGERMLQSLSVENQVKSTLSVAAPYRLRQHRPGDPTFFATWDSGPGGSFVFHQEKQCGLRKVRGHGFGCALFRAQAFAEHRFTCQPGPPDAPSNDYDINFFEWANNRHMGVSFVDWSLICAHGPASLEKEVTE